VKCLIASTHSDTSTTPEADMVGFVYGLL